MNAATSNPDCGRVVEEYFIIMRVCVSRAARLHHLQCYRLASLTLENTNSVPIAISQQRYPLFFAPQVAHRTVADLYKVLDLEKKMWGCHLLVQAHLKNQFRRRRGWRAVNRLHCLNVLLCSLHVSGSL